jgi:uncharacterized protein YutE (UPF0331/DUF86 family)
MGSLVTDADVLAKRLLVVSDTLGELARPECRDVSKLRADRMLAAAVERWLQVAIEACIDVAHHVIAGEGWTPPPTGKAAFETLAAHGRIDGALAHRLGSAVGLRNLLVHDYASIDLERIARVVAHDLDDLRDFARVAATWIDA